MRRQTGMYRVLAAIFMVSLVSFPLMPPAAARGAGSPRISDSSQMLSIPLAFPEATGQADESGRYLRLEIEFTTGYALMPGAPMLPMWGTMLSFPPGTEINEAQISDAVTDSHVLPQKVFPAPQRVPNVAGAAPAPPFEGPAYSRNAFYPETRLTSSLTTGMDDSGLAAAHLFVKVFPILYNPVTGRAVQLRSATLNVRYSLPAPILSMGNESHDILVLAPPEFETEMAIYAQQKESVGFSVKVVNLTTVYSSAIFNVSQGRDNQEKIKLFVASARQNWSIKYVVLAGDTDKFPTRTADISDIDGTSTPSDLYYGDLFKGGNFTFCDWDRDRDGRYAESSSSSANPDGVDFDPDVAVGRFPASTASELRAMINKTVAYAANVSVAWFQNATLVGSDTFANRDPWYDTSGVAEGEYGCDRSSTYIPLFNFSKFYETKGTFNANNIKNCLNLGEGFALFADHGNVDGVVYPSTGGVGLTSSTASSLSNGAKLPLSVLDACLTHAIDYGECLGEYLVLNHNGGSINSIGATRIGYGMFGIYHTYANSGYMMVHLMEHFANGTIMPGPMLDATKRGYLADVGIWDYADVKTLVEYIQLGDPVTFIGGQGLEHSMGCNSLMADPGAPVFYHLQLNNTALHAEHVDVSVTGGMWDRTLDTSRVTIPAKSSVNITLRVDVSPLANAYETDNCTIVLVPASTGLAATMNVTTGANRVRKVWYSIDRSGFFADPGDDISFNYSITNDGNIVENVLLRMWGGDGRFWDMTSTLADRTIGPRDSVQGKARFSVPAKCLAGAYSFRVAAWTEGLASSTTPIQVTVQEVSGFELGALDDHVRVSFRARFDLVVENTGNHFDHCGISVDQIPNGWAVSCPPMLGIDAYSSTSAVLIAMPGPSTIAGDYTLSVSLYSEKGFLFRTLNLTATVDPNTSLDALCPENIQIVERGRDASFSLLLKSRSNFEESVSFFPVELPDGWMVSAAPDTVEVAPFGSKDVAITVQIPSDAAAGIHIVKIEARTTGWSKSLALSVDVLEQISFSTYIDRGQDRLLPGAESGFCISIRNTGNCPDRYVLSAVGPLSICFSENMIGLDPGSSVTSGVDIGVPQMTPSGDYCMTITISSVRDPSVKRTVTVEIRVERISRLSLSYDNASRAGRGEEGGFWLEAGNRGPETETVRIEATSPSWNAGCPVLTIPPCSTRRAFVSYTVPDALDGGDYDLCLLAGSGLQSWNITHRVSVPAAPPVRVGDINVPGNSQYPLVLAISAILMAVLAGAFIAIRAIGKRQNGKTA